MREQKLVIRKNKRRYEVKAERGAVVIEATLSLTTFVFAIITILSLINIAYLQAKMGVALNSAAKEISQYSYLYYKFGLDEFEASLADGTDQSKKTVQNTIDGVGQIMDSLSNAENSLSTGNIDSMFSELERGAASADSLVTMYAEEIAEDPKGFIVGMGKLARSELTQEAKVKLGEVLAKAFMKKNLKSSAEENPDSFLKRHHVVDGMDGLDFNYTTLMANGTSNEINLVVSYDVEVIQLLNIDFHFKFRQCAKTTAWGNGISLIHPRSIWETMAPVNRGVYIVGKEKEGYTYTSNSNGYQAYNNSWGKNEFIAITSLDTTMQTYQTKAGVKGRLNSEFSKMYSGVSKLDESITVKNSSGNDVTLTSNTETRKYKIVIVVPEGADQSVIKEAITEFKNSKSGYTIAVEVKEGYGSIKKDGEKSEATDE